ncbi:hypothetical protein FCM35_KLT05719 [Carex littledalei]|uniref:Uncharacterized protein n=1 Tax=Carex littledalei TaxID=544730 RepID=A0A833R269_9POAL|nr:hypothetical protein FCM35_KLT05719 [Carex littledalei]
MSGLGKGSKDGSWHPTVLLGYKLNEATRLKMTGHYVGAGHDVVGQQIMSLKRCKAEGPASFGDSPTVSDEPYKKRMRCFKDFSDKEENSLNGNIVIAPRDHAPEVVL